MPTTVVKEFRLPDLGEGLVDAEIVRWLVAVGDPVAIDQPIVEVETAKATVEIPARWAGTVAAIFHEEGRTVTVGTPIIAIDTGVPGGNGSVAVLVGYGPAVERPARRSRPLAKPPVRKLAKDLGVDLRSLVGTGPSGSITRTDVERATRPDRAGPANNVDRADNAGRVGNAGRADHIGHADRVDRADRADHSGRVDHADHADRRTAQAGSDTRADRRIPISGVRRAMAANMVASASAAPQATVFTTVDVTRSVRAIRRLRHQPRWATVKVSPLLLVAKAALVAITRYPEVNATWDGDAILVRQYVNLGIAVATERGLVVPSVKDAGKLTTYQLASELNAAATAARQAMATPADLTGSTFTITNVGVFGVETGTPVVPLGQAAILVLGAVREAPLVHKGRIRPRMVTTLGLSFDHRIVDGELGSRFLFAIGEFLQDPEVSLLAWS